VPIVVNPLADRGYRAPPACVHTVGFHVLWTCNQDGLSNVKLGCRDIDEATVNYIPGMVGKIVTPITVIPSEPDRASVTKSNGKHDRSETARTRKILWPLCTSMQRPPNMPCLTDYVFQP
jgi:hypothetical protein